MSYTPKINIQILNNSINKPFYGSENSAGMDLEAAISKDILLPRFERFLIPTGIKIEMPNNCEGQIRPRSGLSLKHGITVLNSPGTIDPDYRGEIKIIIINLGETAFTITPGMRIAQLVISRVEKVQLVFVDTLKSKSIRGEKGFGSSGLK
mgnify:CR=1 FL=1